MVFRRGDLDGALSLLKPMQRRSDGKARQLSDSLREIWNRNQLERKRLDALVNQERWWEALDSLNRLDHPWWQAKAGEQRERIEAAIDVLGHARNITSTRPAIATESRAPNLNRPFRISSAEAWTPGMPSRPVAEVLADWSLRMVPRVSAGPPSQGLDQIMLFDRSIQCSLGTW